MVAFEEETAMQTRLRILFAFMALALPLLAVPAFSAGDGGGGGNTGNNCANGKVWDKKTSKCVPQQSGIDDDTLYEYGRDLALVGRYDEAIEVLSLAADKTDARILNYLGYAHRKSGRVLVG